MHLFKILPLVYMHNKKLSYRRGTARRSMLVSSCYVSRGMGEREREFTFVKKYKPRALSDLCGNKS